MILRRLNQAGIEAFRQFLETCRSHTDINHPCDLLEDSALTTVVQPTIEVDQRHFGERRDAAHYLNGLLQPLSDHQIESDAGLWTWLSLCFFDEICPLRNGRRQIKKDYSYIFEPMNSRHVYRHLLFVAWRLLKLAPTHNRLFLGGPVSSLDQATSEVMKRLYITRIPCVFEVLDRLYWDKNRGRIRSGVVTTERVSPGDLRHRFPIRIRQLEMTYDLQSLNADQLIELLGAEFQNTDSPIT